MNKTPLALALLAAVAAAGCISVKTESEIKPIHITMDVNLKVDKELDRQFAEENKPQPSGNFKLVKEAAARGAVGFTSLAMLAARDGATDDDKILVAEENARRLKRYNEVAKSSGVALESVQKRRAAQIRKRVPAGTWLQDDVGAWKQK